MIISKFKDYYDWAFYTYPDPKIKYFRESSFEELHKSIKQKHSGSYDDIRKGINRMITIVPNSFSEIPNFKLFKFKSILLIGDKALPFNAAREHQSHNGLSRSILFGVLNKTLKIQILEDSFSETELSELTKDIREHHKEPIVLLLYDTFNSIVVINNPNLSEIMIENKPEDLMILGEISMYLGKQNSEKGELPEFDDLTKRNSKGFDNISFKKRK